MKTIVIATRNRHKVQEIRALLDGVTLLDLNDFPAAPPVVEDAPTFAGNAIKKAVELARWLHSQRHLNAGHCVLADDSGLEVDALHGAPGVYSARFAALDAPAGATSNGNSPDTANNAKLLRLLQDVPLANRTARFRCVLALATVGGNQAPWLFDGACGGHIDFAPRGKSGFGYDPLFIPNGHVESFAELGESVKNRMSHRARAMIKLQLWLNSGSDKL
ncbi:MAG: non-canonical purine NTP pyrophosphatase [Verrucomicrobiota bacterium]